MPVMWFAKDGARPHSQSGPGTSVSVEEAREIIGGHEIRFAGPAAPSINPNHPSKNHGGQKNHGVRSSTHARVVQFEMPGQLRRGVGTGGKGRLNGGVTVVGVLAFKCL